MSLELEPRDVHRVDPLGAESVARAGVWSRALAVAGRHRDALMVLPLLLATAILHGFNLAGWPPFFDDEGTYLSQAYATYQGELAPYTYWYDHPPVGWIQLAAVAWLPSLFVEVELVAGRLAMVAFSLTATVLIYGTARRLRMRRGFALATSALWAFSPLTVLEARQVLLDTIAVPWLLGAMFLALSRTRHLEHYFGAGFCLGIAVLTKETTVVFAPAIVWAAWQSSDRRTRPFALVSLLVSFAVTTGAYVLFAVLKGEFFPGDGHVSLLGALMFQLSERRGSGFILDEGSGAYGVLQYWLGYDRVLVIGGIAAALLAVLVSRLRTAAVAVLFSAALAMRPNGYLPFMYVTTALPFGALVIGGMLDALWSAPARRDAPDRAVPLREVGSRTLLARMLLVLTLCLGAGAVARGWRTHDEVALTADMNSAHARAVAWMKANVSTDTVVVADNVYWLDLVEAGWNPGWGAVWFTKLDLDPEARRRLPGGWRDVDYVIWSKAFAYTRNRLPITEQLHVHSTVVAVFGTNAEDRVQIRRVTQCKQASTPRSWCPPSTKAATSASSCAVWTLPATRWPPRSCSSTTRRMTPPR